MGLNVDNLFIKGSDRDQIMELLPRILPASKWKMAVSPSKDGWIQLIDSHENTPPHIARDISAALSCPVVCVQIYEAVGEAGWHNFDSGRQVESRMTEEPEEVMATLRSQVGAQTVLMFREVVKNPVWQIVQRK